MSARRSAATEQAIRLIQESGKTLYEAAAMAGVWPSTLYRALYPKGKKKIRKGIDKTVA